MARKPSTVDNVWTLFQTRTVREIAKQLNVDRRTVQRWKNQGQIPVQKNEQKLSRRASHDRRQFREHGATKREHFAAPKIPVPLFGRRQYVTEEIKPSRKAKENREAWESAKRRSVALGRQFDRFYARKDKKGRTRYYRAQDAGTVVFDLRRARMQDILRLFQSFQGEGRSMVLIHTIKREYKMKDGTILAPGTHMGSTPEVMDQRKFTDEAAVLDFLNDRQRKGQLTYLRVTEPRK